MRVRGSKRKQSRLGVPTRQGPAPESEAGRRARSGLRALVGLVAAPDPTKRIERALLKPWMVKAALLPTLLFVGRGVGDAVRLTNMLRRRLALG